MVTLNDNLMCCGCSACVNVCPTKCIELKEDNEGFLVPFFVEGTKCINCSKCEEVCPVINTIPEKEHFEKAYIVQNTDQKVRRESTSGGMWSAIASTVLANGGVVFGAMFDKDFNVIHAEIKTHNELSKSRNSKYVQSNLKNTYTEALNYLKEGKTVLFSGTPCQIEGLKNFVGNYENLITVDMVCYGIASPLIFRKYLEFQNRKPDKIYFRNKHNGYKFTTMSFFENDKEVYFNGSESDRYLRAYLSNNALRKHCYNCNFKKRYRISDFTLSDCFYPFVFNKEFDDDKGTTSVLVNSKKGIDLLKEMLEKGIIRAFEVSPYEMIKGDYYMIASAKYGDKRDAFLSEANSLSGNELFDKYFPDTAKIKLMRIARKLMLTFGIYRFIRNHRYLCYLKKVDEINKGRSK